MSWETKETTTWSAKIKVGKRLEISRNAREGVIITDRHSVSMLYVSDEDIPGLIEALSSVPATPAEFAS
jgi:hypothetical protein